MRLIWWFLFQCFKTIKFCRKLYLKLHIFRKMQMPACILKKDIYDAKILRLISFYDFTKRFNDTFLVH